MKAIVAADKNWGIGKEGKLLVRIPLDMKRFRQETLGKCVILGRKTLETFPGGLPLEGRDNIILTRNPRFKVKGAKIARSMEELQMLLEDYASEDVYVIGGEQIYRLLIDSCDTVLVTRLDRVYDADAFFPSLEEADGFRITKESEEESFFDTTYRFVTYERTLK